MQAHSCAPLATRNLATWAILLVRGLVMRAAKPADAQRLVIAFVMPVDRFGATNLAWSALD
jgi:hypothetical protein